MENTPLDFFEDQKLPVNDEPLKTISPKGCAVGCLGIILPYCFAVWGVYYTLWAKFEDSPTMKEFPVLVWLSIMLCIFIAILIPSTIELVVFRKWFKTPKVRGRLLLLIFIFYNAIGGYGLWIYLDDTQPMFLF